MFRASLWLGCARRDRGTVGMGASKAGLPQCPNAHRLSMGMDESSREVEERARGKTIP